MVDIDSYFQWLRNVSWDYASNVRYAQTAENVGFEYALTQIRFMAGYGAVCTLLGPVLSNH